MIRRLHHNLKNRWGRSVVATMMTWAMTWAMTWGGACVGVGGIVGGLCFITSVPTSAQAAITLHGVWRFGEDDGVGATEGASAIGSTIAQVGVDLASTGSPIYATTNTAPGSEVAINLGLADQYQVGSVATTATDNFVIEVWFNYTSGLSGLPTFPIASNGSSGTNGFALGVLDGRWAGLYGSAGWLPTDVLATVGTWTHLALVRDGGMARFFIDGVEQTINLGFATAASVLPTLGTSPITPADELVIGQAGTMAGLVDTMRIYTFTGGGEGGGFDPGDLFFHQDVPEPATGLILGCVGIGWFLLRRGGV